MKEINLWMDGDMIVFQCAASVEREVHWYGDVWTLSTDEHEAWEKIVDRVTWLRDSAMEKYYSLQDDDEEYVPHVILCFSSPYNFRKMINKEYKSNRKGVRKPMCYRVLVDRCKENFTCIEYYGLEADDLMGLFSDENSIIVSGDKDLGTIPETYFYDFSRDTFRYVSKSAADLQFWKQVLQGDACDGYKGCPKVGEKTALKILGEQGCNWTVVKDTFISKGQTVNDALYNARMARILRHGEYKNINHEGYVKLYGNKDFIKIPVQQ